MAASVERDVPCASDGDDGTAAVRHVAIIMDGNGRWVKQRGLPRTEGHRQGLAALRGAVRYAVKRGIEVLTLYSFSSENWSRPSHEVDFLMGLLHRFVQRDLAELHDANIHIRVIGARDDLAAGIRALIDEAEAVTRNNTGMTLVIAFNYGARDELTRAMHKIAGAVARGELDPDQIDAATIDGALDTAGLPDPDLIIRTSGELRLSNFLLWQAAYTEFFFSPVNWPDFDEARFDEALAAYAARERRYGGLPKKAVP